MKAWEHKREREGKRQEKKRNRDVALCTVLFLAGKFSR